MQTLLSFDPGQTTGVARFTSTVGECWVLTNTMTFTIDLEDPRRGDWSVLGRLVHDLPTYILCEHSTVSDPAFRLHGVYVEGALMYLASICGLHLALRSPSFLVAGTKWAGDLRKVATEHERDAIRHAVVWLKSHEKAVDLAL